MWLSFVKNTTEKDISQTGKGFVPFVNHKFEENVQYVINVSVGFFPTLCIRIIYKRYFPHCSNAYFSLIVFYPDAQSVQYSKLDYLLIKCVL